MTPLQRAILAALSRTAERSNAQVAAAARCSEAYAARVLHRLASDGAAVSRRVQDAEDPQTHFRLWRRA